jgi:UDP-perosamine 4-acetyltransferase
MPRAVINCHTSVGDNVLVNTGAVVEHDCRIDSHVHIAPGVTLGGGVSVASGCHVELGASVIQSVRLGVDSIVAAGAVVVEDVADGVMVAGVPAVAKRRQGSMA